MVTVLIRLVDCDGERASEVKVKASSIDEWQEGDVAVDGSSRLSSLLQLQAWVLVVLRRSSKIRSDLVWIWYLDLVSWRFGRLASWTSVGFVGSWVAGTEALAALRCLRCSRHELVGRFDGGLQFVLNRRGIKKELCWDRVGVGSCLWRRR